MAPRDVQVEDRDAGRLPESLRPLSCRALDRQLLWCVAAAPADAGMLVRLAPAGLYGSAPDLVRDELIPWALCEEQETLAASELLGRTFWFDARARRPLPPLRLLPRRIAGPRPLLLAATPAGHPWGARALEDQAGSLLAAAAGTTLPGMLESFETLYLLEAEGEPRHTALRRLEDGRLDGRLVVVVGVGTARALGNAEQPDLSRYGGTLVGVAPHPNGKLLWKMAGAREVARALLADALLCTRGELAVGDPAEMAAAASDLRAGRWPGWQAAADQGVAGHSPATGHAWRPFLGQAGLCWRRRWLGGSGLIEPDGRGGFVATIDARPDRDVFRTSALEGLADAVALVERTAACAALVEVAGKGVRGG